MGPLHWQEARAAGLLLEALAKQSLDYNYKARFIWAITPGAFPEHT